LITLAVLILLAILGVNTHFVKRSSQYLREGLELEGESFEDRKKAREDKERLDRDLKDAQIGALKGFQADNSHYNFQKPPNEEECMTVMDVDDENRFPHKLIYSNEITKYFQEIIKDLEDLVKIGKVNPELDERNDKFALHLKRRNMVMYGAPGTGKTELIVQLARIIKERYEM
jgi:DNA replication protein DnaC